MTEWTWINGEVMPLADARICVEDRGFQFADGVYEVIRIYNGRPFTLAEHVDRLKRSCAGIELAAPIALTMLPSAIESLIARSGIRDGMVYLQVTRGAAPRNHLFPLETKPTMLFYVRSLPPVPRAGDGAGVKLVTVADERWKRCWVKSIALLPNVLAKNAAIAAGADEAVFVDEGVVNECSASNLFAVINGTLITHPIGPKVLPGITRALLLDIARAAEIRVEERALAVAEAEAADELLITSTTREISWVAQWNDLLVGKRACGAVTLRLHRALQERVARETIAKAP